MILALLLAAQTTAAQPAAAPASAAPPVFADFQTLCVAHRGDLAAPIADADAQGYMQVPPSMLSALPGAFTNVQARAKLSDAGAEFVFTGQGDLPAEAGAAAGSKSNMCFLGAQNVDYAGVAAQAKAYAAMPAYQETGDQTVYAYTDKRGVRAPLDPKDNAALSAAVKMGVATVLIVRTIPGGALVGYAVPTP